MIVGSSLDIVPQPIITTIGRDTRVHWGFYASALAIEANLLALHAYEAARIPVVPFVLHFLLAFVAYAAALPLVLRRSPPSTGPSLSLILGCALIFRLTVLLIPPIWDDDLYRYCWDGRVGLHGINPYLYAPEAAELENLQDDHYDFVSFKSIRTIYPPLFQFLFQLSAWIAPSSLSFLKCLALFFDVALISVLMSLLKRLRYSHAWILIYAWNPLSIKEFANSGHMDSLVLFLLFLSLRCLLDRRFVLSHLVLGLSVLAKLFSGIALPFLLFEAYRRSRSTFLLSLTTFGAVLFLGYAPFVQAGSRLFEGLSVYSRYWNFNAGLFWLVERGLNPLAGKPWWFGRALVLAGVTGVVVWQFIVLMRGRSCRSGREHQQKDRILPPQRRIGAGSSVIRFLPFRIQGGSPLVAAWPQSEMPARPHFHSSCEAPNADCASVSLPQRKRRDWLAASTESAPLLKAVFYSLASLVLLSPAVQPWYICWLVPFCVFFPRASWISLSGLTVLSYLFYLNFAEMVWPRFAEFGIPAGIAIWEWTRNENRQKRHRTVES